MENVQFVSGLPSVEPASSVAKAPVSRVSVVRTPIAPTEKSARTANVSLVLMTPNAERARNAAMARAKLLNAASMPIAPRGAVRRACASVAPPTPNVEPTASAATAHVYKAIAVTLHNVVEPLV